MTDGTYHEPFLGGGSVFFGLPIVARARLTDRNSRLIETYRAVRDAPEQVIGYLRTYENTESFYYFVREQTFEDAFERAAQFIYLNQTSFNGIYRVNLKGTYNVPFGHRSKPFLDVETINLASRKLKNVQLCSEDFYEGVSEVRAGDFVFLDPPYTVSHNKNGFIKYNEKLFALDDLYRLRDYIVEIKARGAFYLMTNAAHDDVRAIFDVGDTVIEASRASLVGGRGAQRGAVGEFIFTNLGGFDGRSGQG